MTIIDPDLAAKVRADWDAYREIREQLAEEIEMSAHIPSLAPLAKWISETLTPNMGLEEFITENLWSLSHEALDDMTKTKMPKLRTDTVLITEFLRARRQQATKGSA